VPGGIDEAPATFGAHRRQSVHKDVHFLELWIDDNLPGLVDESPSVSHLDPGHTFGKCGGTVELRVDENLSRGIGVPIMARKLDGG
jgi:hypothetical protein